MQRIDDRERTPRLVHHERGQLHSANIVIESFVFDKGLSATGSYFFSNYVTGPGNVPIAVQAHPPFPMYITVCAYSEGVVGTSPMGVDGVVDYGAMNNSVAEISHSQNDTYCGANSYGGGGLAIFATALHSAVPNPANLNISIAVANANIISTATAINTTIAHLNNSYVNHYWAGANASITLNNTALSPTTANMVQTLYFNASSNRYAPFETANLGNIRFYGGGQELYSWRQSGCFYTSTNTIFQVKIPYSIAASSTNIISLDFLPYTSNYIPQYDGIYAGEAPQLTCTNANVMICGGTYGQYDNGNQVFTFYDNFAGQSINTGVWNTVSTVGGGGAGTFSTVTVSNGVTITTNGLLGYSLIRTIANVPASPVASTDALILNFYTPGTSSANPYIADVQSYAVPGLGTYPANGMAMLCVICSAYNFHIYTFSTTGSAASVNTLTPSYLLNRNIWSLQWLYQGNTIDTDGIMTGNSASSLIVRSTVGYHLVAGTGQCGSTSGVCQIALQWIRARILPPSDIMPLFTISNVSVQSSAEAPTLPMRCRGFTWWAASLASQQTATPSCQAARW